MRRALLLTSLGVAGGQAVVLLATPLLARKYDPEQFGVFAGVMAVAGVLAAIASLRFDAALPAVRDQDVRPIFRIAILLPFVVCPISIISLALLSRLSDSVDAFLRTLPLLAIFAVGIFQGGVAVLLGFQTRSGSFGKYASLRLLQPLVFVFVALVVPISLESATAIGWLFALLLGIILSWSAFGAITTESLESVRRNWKYPIMSTPLTLVDSLALGLPIMFIVGAYGSTEAGNYSQVQRLLGAPLILAGTAVAQVFFKYAGEQYRSGASIIPLLSRFVFGMAGLGLCVVVFILAIGSQVIGWVLGPGWRLDTQFLLLAFLPALARALVSPISSVFLLSDRISLLGIWQVVYLIVILVVSVKGSAVLTFDEFILAIAFFECLMYSMYLCLAVYLGNQRSK